MTGFSTAEDAQKSFYDAIERANLETMMGIWSHDEDIVCIHPGGRRHTGFEQVKESWRLIFANGPQLRFKIASARSYRARMLSVHNLYEQITNTGGMHPPTSVLATNIFVRTGDEWKMLLHHASLIHEQQLETHSAPSASKLH